MEVREIHSCHLHSEKEFSEIQDKLIHRIELKNNFHLEDVSLIAGVDLAYWEKDDKHYGTCCIVVIDYHTKKEVEKVYSYGEVTVPYIPGFLAFRELPLVIEAAKKLTSNPDIFMFDGNGYLHYKHMGIATHASFFLQKPTIGVAKSYLKIKDVDFIMPENKAFTFSDIMIDDEVYGRVLRTKENVKPIFVSCGNNIDLDTSVQIVSNLIGKESRLPIPVRLADLETHKVRRDKRENDK
ncbi:endonuclease V [Bacillus pseudomycoides]|uniref:Endonuclease V n=1 Tax=Bacillus pseudomycoides TaxID=64104 RepID=A0ABD6T842_9BACI|nr:endonuclease V [Bacillus pseudomycoides]PEP86782.1 endonuclease V [Bacillus pseudomycoides]PGF09523.1 endonuclease V [Bacillus pseudomycoides]PHC39761.1 endonuclease V [Bacillus pseudomycoides]PHE89295.1 endonuclease V [Bacillus pseudomycoides]